MRRENEKGKKERQDKEGEGKKEVGNRRKIR